MIEPLTRSRLSYDRFSPDVQQWIRRGQDAGLDLHELAVGLICEWNLHETYNSLQKAFQAFGWPLPPPNRSHRFQVIRDMGCPNQASLLEDGQIHKRFADTWQSVLHAHDIARDTSCDRVSRASGMPDDDGVEQELASWASSHASVQHMQEYPVEPPHVVTEPSFTTQQDRLTAEQDPDIETLVAEVTRTVLQKLNPGWDYAARRRPALAVSLGDIPESATALVIGDLHIPFDDRAVIATVLGFAKVLDPQFILLNGDLIDCEEISRWDGSRYSTVRFLEEADLGVRFLTAVRTQHPNARILYIYGNHEYRFEHYVHTHAGALEDLPGTSLAEVLTLKTLEIAHQDVGLRENMLPFGDLYVGHWDSVRKHAAYTAHNMVMDLGVSIIQAHVHRCGLIQKRYLDRLAVGIESGCLCQLDPHFKLHTNWQHGFSTITRIGGRCYPQLVPIYPEGFCYDGQFWPVTRSTPRTRTSADGHPHRLAH